MLTGHTSRRTLLSRGGAGLLLGALGGIGTGTARAQTPAATPGVATAAATPVVTSEPVPDLTGWVIQPNEIGQTWGLGSASMLYTTTALVNQQLISSALAKPIASSFRLGYVLTAYRPAKTKIAATFGRAVYSAIISLNGADAASAFFETIAANPPRNVADQTGTNHIGDGKTAIWQSNYLQPGTNATVNRLAATFLVGPALCFLTIDGADGAPTISEMTDLGNRFADRVKQGQANKRFSLGWAAIRLTTQDAATFALTRDRGADIPIFNESTLSQKRRAYYNDGAVTVLEDDFPISNQIQFASALFEFKTEDDAGLYNGAVPLLQSPTFEALGITVLQNPTARTIGDASKSFFYTVAVPESNTTRFGYLRAIRIGPVVTLADLLETKARPIKPPAKPDDLAKMPPEITVLWTKLDGQLATLLTPWAAHVTGLTGGDSAARHQLAPPMQLRVESGK